MTSVYFYTLPYTIQWDSFLPLPIPAIQSQSDQKTVVNRAGYQTVINRAGYQRVVNRAGYQTVVNRAGYQTVTAVSDGTTTNMVTVTVLLSLSVTVERV